jgi:hypothetical protein
LVRASVVRLNCRHAIWRAISVLIAIEVEAISGLGFEFKWISKELSTEVRSIELAGHFEHRSEPGHRFWKRLPTRRIQDEGPFWLWKDWHRSNRIIGESSLGSCDVLARVGREER